MESWNFLFSQPLVLKPQNSEYFRQEKIGIET